MWNFPECIITHLLCIVSDVLQLSFVGAATCDITLTLTPPSWTTTLKHHTPHLPLQAYIMKWPKGKNKQTNKQVVNARFSLVHMCTWLTQLKTCTYESSTASVWCAFGIWFEEKKQRRLVHCQIEVFWVFLCFHSEMWKLLHRGIIVLMKKTPLGWFN